MIRTDNSNWRLEMMTVEIREAPRKIVKLFELMQSSSADRLGDFKFENAWISWRFTEGTAEVIYRANSTRR